MERPASRGGRIGDRGGSRLDASDEEEELSRAESFHSRRSHTTTGGTGHSRLVQLMLFFGKNKFEPVFFALAIWF